MLLPGPFRSAVPAFHVLVKWVWTEKTSECDCISLAWALGIDLAEGLRVVRSEAAIPKAEELLLLKPGL